MSRKAIYTGIFLDDSSKVSLLSHANMYGGMHSKVLAHHLTLVFSPSFKDVAELAIGSYYSIAAIGIAKDEKAQAVVCNIPDELCCSNIIPHITVSVADNIKPVYSNILLKNGYKAFNTPLTLTGRIGFFDGAVRFSFENSIYKV